jgi:aarF domain-containing kinase
MYLEQAARVAKKELALECDYEYELKSQQRFKQLVDSDASLRGQFSVPEVIPELSSKRVLASRLVPGVPIDKVALLGQEARNEVGTRLLRLTLKELFEWRFMQTDPNWGNFLYDTGEPSHGECFSIMRWKLCGTPVQRNSVDIFFLCFSFFFPD